MAMQNYIKPRKFFGNFLGWIYSRRENFAKGTLFPRLLFREKQKAFAELFTLSAIMASFNKKNPRALASIFYGLFLQKIEKVPASAFISLYTYCNKNPKNPGPRY